MRATVGASIQMSKHSVFVLFTLDEQRSISDGQFAR